jgi:hypothetical protein
LLRLLIGSTEGAFRQQMPSERCAPPLRYDVDAKRADERRDVLGAASPSLGWQFARLGERFMVRQRNEVHCVGRSDALRLDCVAPEQVGERRNISF